MKKRILVISPHADDEVLGCGAYIRRMSESGHRIDVVIVAVGAYTNSEGVLQNPNQKLDEIQDCHTILGINTGDVWYNLEGTLDSLPESELVAKIDMRLRLDYDEIFIPYRSNHVDHKAIHDACLASFRLKSNWRVERCIYYYEYPFISTYDRPNGGAVYFPISEQEKEDKIAAFECYESQIKKSPSPLNREGITTLLRMRGMEIGETYAEKFYLHHKILR